MPPSATTRRFWENTAARLAARVNFSAWLDAFAPSAFAVLTAAAVAVYALRRTRGPEHWVWPTLAAGLVIAGFVAWRLARHLGAVQRYIRRVLENAKVKRFLQQRYAELLEEFQELAQLEVL
jgi:hypothetical protein